MSTIKKELNPILKIAGQMDPRIKGIKGIRAFWLKNGVEPHMNIYIGRKRVDIVYVFMIYLLNVKGFRSISSWFWDCVYREVERIKKEEPDIWSSCMKTYQDFKRRTIEESVIKD